MEAVTRIGFAVTSASASASSVLTFGFVFHVVVVVVVGGGMEFLRVVIVRLVLFVILITEV